MRLKQRTAFLRFATAHICISSEIAAEIKQKNGISSNCVYLVYNGVDTANARLLPRSDSGSLRLLHVGRIMIGHQKRTDDLLHALATIHGEWHLDIMGAGEDVPALQRLSEQLGVANRLTWHGWRQKEIGGETHWVFAGVDWCGLEKRFRKGYCDEAFWNSCGVGGGGAVGSGCEGAVDFAESGDGV